MKTRRLLWGVILLFNFPLVAAVHHVGPGFTLITIGEALELVSFHDTIMVHPATYYESDLVVEVPISILGLPGAIINGSGEGEILTILADSVVVSGLTFQESGLSYLDDNAAIRVDEAHDCILSHNILEDNFFGIYLAKSSGTRIIDNRIMGQAKTESKSGNGIHLWYCRDIEIRNNHTSGHRDGIYLEFVENCTISSNESFGNLRYGLHFMYSDSNRYTNNVFRDNGSGVAVMYSRQVDMWNNIYIDNWGDAAFGLLLKDIYDSSIRNSRFQGNTTAIYMESSNRLSIRENEFVGNGWALKVMANCMDNEFYDNDFIDNSFDVATNSIQNFNSFEHNYWQRYKGFDLNSDGYGDQPYRPVKLFSILAQQNEPTLILMRSPFVQLLEQAEDYLPVFTPTSLWDQHPRMRARE